MEKSNIKHFVEEWPAGLKTAAEISEKLGIPKERIIELADAHYMPHWRIEKGEPLFQFAEVKRWAAKNVLTRIGGGTLPINLRVMVDPPAAKDAPPEIREIPNLKEVPIANYPPGVYFLVQNDCVVYVGQSVNPIARITQHTDKEFSHAYMIPVPSSLLNAVEGALIRAMNPPLNSGTRTIAVGPGEKSSDEFALKKFAEGLIV